MAGSMQGSRRQPCDSRHDAMDDDRIGVREHLEENVELGTPLVEAYGGRCMELG